MPLFHIGGAIAIAQQQEVHLVSRRAVLNDRPAFGPARRRAAINRRAGRIELDCPRVSKRAPCLAPLDGYLHSLRGRGKSDGFFEASLERLRLVGFDPFVKDGGVTARIEDALRGLLPDLEPILAEAGLVDGAIQRTRPGALDRHAVESKMLGARPAGMEVVHAHGARLLRGDQRRTAKRYYEESVHLLMSNIHTPVTPELWDYIRSVSLREPEVLRRIREATANHPHVSCQ